MTHHESTATAVVKRESYEGLSADAPDAGFDRPESRNGLARLLHQFADCEIQCETPTEGHEDPDHGGDRSGLAKWLIVPRPVAVGGISIRTPRRDYRQGENDSRAPPSGVARMNRQSSPRARVLGGGRPRRRFTQYRRRGGAIVGTLVAIQIVDNRVPVAGLA